MTLKRHYLKTEEIGIIVSAMLNEPNEFTRQITKYGLTAFLLIDDYKDSEDEDGNIDSGKIYNELMENAIDLDKEVYNIQIVDKIVERELGVAKTVEKILNGVIAQIDESMKAIDPKALMVELDKLKDSEAFKMLAKA